MQVLITILIGFARLSDKVLLAFARNVILKMTGNKNFPNPLPKLADVSAAADTLESSMAAAKNGGKTLTTIKKQKKGLLVTILKALALYVQQNCNNDQAFADSSGFNTKQPSKKQTVPYSPVNVQAKQGTHLGEINVWCDAQKGVKLWQCRYTTDPTWAEWINAEPQTSRKFVITGLNHGDDVFVCMSAGNSAGISGWTDPINIVVA